MDEDLVGNEISRRVNLNSSLARLGLRAHRMESLLSMLQWGGPLTDGRGPCPYCLRFPAQNHDVSCQVAQALRHQDPITHAEETIRFLRDLVRNQAHTVEVHSRMVQLTLSELLSALDQADQILERL